MKLVLSVVLFLFISTFSYAQIKISGTITDNNNRPVPFIAVTLLQESDFIQGNITDSIGHFTFANLKKGRHQLVVNYMGRKDSLASFVLNKDTIVNVIFSPGIELEEVSVIGSKPVVERKIDRLVFNVNNTSAALGMNVIDVLNLTPLVKVEEEGFGIVGKNKVQIMIDGKRIYLTGSELMQYLNSIQSDNVAKVEVITAPPAKYDAEGNSGLINIVLKRKTDLGWKASIASGYVQSNYGSCTNSITFDYLLEKLFLSVKLNQNYRKKKIREEYGIYERELYQNSSDRRIDKLNSLSPNIAIEYRLGRNGVLGGSYSFGDNNELMNIDNRYSYFSNNSVDSLLLTFSKHDEKSKTHIASVYYDLILDTLGRKVSISNNFYHNGINKHIALLTINDRDNEQNVAIPSDLIYRIYTGQVDVELPQRFVNIDFGLKYTDIINNSGIEYYNDIRGKYVQDMSRSNTFNYKEKVIAGYVNLNKELVEKIVVQFGLRYEYSFVKGITPNSIEKDVQRNYSKLFPTFYFSYEPTESRVLNISYSKRINRPDFSALNPFKWYTNPYSWGSGNPLLSPSYNHNVELNYVYNNNLSLSFYYQKELNAYDQVTRVQDDTTYDIYENIYNNDCFGINLSYTIRWLKWWRTYAMADYSYNRSKGMSSEFQGLSGSAFSYRIDNTISLDRKKRMELFLNYMQTLPYKEGVTSAASFANCIVGIRCVFMDKRLALNVVANDIFKQSTNRGKMFTANSKQIYNNYYDARALKINIVYQIGAKKIKHQKKNVEFDEMYRAN